MCWCKKKSEDLECYVSQITTHPDVNVVLPPPSPTPQLFYSRPSITKSPDPSVVDRLVLETLGVIETLVDKYETSDKFMTCIENIFL